MKHDNVGAQVFILTILVVAILLIGMWVVTLIPITPSS